MMVSVIIPNYNHEKYLVERIESVLKQTYQDFEVIILDDCSTDSSRQIIERYREHLKVAHILYNQNNSGSPFAQWHKGITHSSGKYIWIAESDDYCTPDFLARTVNTLEQNPGTVLCYTNSNIVENGLVDDSKKPSFYYNTLFNTDRWSYDFKNHGKDELINYMGGFCTIINASSCVFLKSAYPVNTKASEFKYCGDWLIWIELFTKGDISFLSAPLNYFRIHQKSTINQFSKVKKAKELYYCLNYAKKLTNKLSRIPPNTLDEVMYIWTHHSLYFFLRNFRPSLFMMHAKLDKDFFRKIKQLSKNYLKLKFSKN